MSDYEAFRASQPGRAVIDKPPTVQEIDADIRECLDSTLERYSRDFDAAQVGARSWEALPIEQKRAVRARNELARREHEKQRAAAKAAEQAKAEAAQNARIAAEIDAYKRQVRGVWKGDQASFDREWPALLSEWQRDQARAQIDATKAAVRARLVDF